MVDREIRVRVDGFVGGLTAHKNALVLACYPGAPDHDL